MLTASIAVGLILLIGNSFGSVSIVLTPIVVGVGRFTWFLFIPFVTAITSALDH